MLERNKEKSSLPLKQQNIVHGFIVFRFAGTIELLVNVLERPFEPHGVFNKLHNIKQHILILTKLVTGHATPLDCVYILFYF